MSSETVDLPLHVRPSRQEAELQQVVDGYFRLPRLSRKALADVIATDLGRYLDAPPINELTVAQRGALAQMRLAQEFIAPEGEELSKALYRKAQLALELWDFNRVCRAFDSW